MRTEQIIFVSAAGWQRFTGDGCIEQLPAWPKLQEAALVVLDLPEAVVGLQSCKGKAQFAAAQIEKTLRDQGAIDGESQVLLHRQLTRGDMTQVFYTAVASSVWQEYRAWADQQKDHCLLIALAALLPIQARAADAVVLRSGPHLLGYAERDGQLLFASAMAFGEQPDDFTVPAASLIAQLQPNPLKESQPWRLCWAAVWALSEQSEQRLVNALGLAETTQVRLLAQRSYVDAAGQVEKVSALPTLLHGLPMQAIAAPALARLAWLTDRSLPWLTAAILALAVVFGGGAGWLQSQLHAQTRNLDELQLQVQVLRSQISSAQSMEAPLSNNEERLQLARHIGYAVRYNPMEMLNVIQEIAGDTIRIQRLQLTRENASNPARFRVDGVVEQGSSERLSQFLAALQARGWQAKAEAPFDGSIGAFAYYLQLQELSAPTAASERQAQP